MFAIASRVRQAGTFPEMLAYYTPKKKKLKMVVDVLMRESSWA